MTKKRSPLHQWEQEMIGAYYDYQFRFDHITLPVFLRRECFLTVRLLQWPARAVIAS